MAATVKKVTPCVRALLQRSFASQPGNPGSKASSAAEDAGATHTQWGSPAFRVLNFELYTKPEGRNRIAAYIGSSAFVGILGYFTYIGWQADQARQPSKVKE